jgi:hypothetical protein
LNRRRRWEDEERLTQLVRAVAIARATEIGDGESRPGD